MFCAALLSIFARFLGISAIIHGISNRFLSTLIESLDFSARSPEIFAEVLSTSGKNPNTFIAKSELCFLIVLFVLDRSGFLKGEKR